MRSTRVGVRVYYGWPVLFVAAAAMVGTLPGRTQGLGLITEPLLADLGLERVAYAELNFWATVLGAAGAVGIGYALDRLGSRLVLSAVSLVLGIVVCLMSATTGVAVLAVWLTLTRLLGQSALSVVSLATVGQWFVRRIDTAMAVYSVTLSIGFMIAFPLVGAIVQTSGWRAAWFSVGAVLVLGLAPLSWLVVRRGPEFCGLLPDGAPLEPPRPGLTHPNEDAPARRAHALPAKARRSDGSIGHDRAIVPDETLTGHRWTTAVLTPAFWVFAAGTALYGLVASGIGLFNESILAERGFGPHVYYQSLVVTAMTGLAGNFLGGWLAGRTRLTLLLGVSLSVLAAALVMLPHVSTLAHVMIWASGMGIGGGLVMVLFFSVWPRAFGRRDLGRIQGSAQALTVLASAIGPLLLAWCVEWTGSYAAVFNGLAAVIASTAAAALIVSMPEPSGLPPIAVSDAE